MIERLVRRRDARGQFAFATEAKRRIPAQHEVVLAKSHRGLHVLGPDEPSLALPLQRLRCAYGAAVAIEPAPEGKPLVEVSVGLENRYLPRVRAALWRRGANPSEEYRGPHYCVLRFQAAPAALLGLPAELASLTGGKASHEIVLRRYA